MERKFTAIHLRSKDEEELFDYKFPPVFFHYVDPLEVLRCYVSGEKYPNFQTRFLTLMQ